MRDIDASLAVMQEEDFDKAEVNDHNVLSWRSYYLNPFDGLALCSGDDTSTKGAEYQDIDVDGLAEKGYHYAVAGLNGYGGSFNEGTVVQGIQIKNEINAKPWDPKNIEFQMNVNANARAYVGFAIDLKSKEIVIINIASEGSIVFGQQQLNLCKRFLNEDYLGINMYDILYRRGEVVENPEDADIVFASNYPSKDKKVIHPFDVDSLIAIVNEKPVQKD